MWKLRSLPRPRKTHASRIIKPKTVKCKMTQAARVKPGVKPPTGKTFYWGH